MGEDKVASFDSPAAGIAGFHQGFGGGFAIVEFRIPPAARQRVFFESLTINWTPFFEAPATNDWGWEKTLSFSSDASKLQATRAMIVPSGDGNLIRFMWFLFQIRISVQKRVTTSNPKCE
jgi:hypothetical protein